jgi:nucleoside 2-deoxyribosyltransferase
VKRRLYLAGPLFSEAERDFNSVTAKRLAAVFEIYLPQTDGGLFTELLENGQNESDARSFIFQRDIEAIRKCDVFLIVLDGRSVDEGASFELGFAHALGKRSVGLQTDPRRLMRCGNNPMIDAALECIFPSVDALLAWAWSLTT